MTKILSWNVNGLRAALKNGFLGWLEAARPDVLCIQESRVLPEELDDSVKCAFGYRTYWNPAQKKGYSGTALFTLREPVSVTTLGASEFDSEGRMQAVEFPEFTILNGYWPNSQSERARLPYKIAWCDAVTRFAAGLVEKRRNVLLCGDFNIAHREMDLARPKENENNAGYYIEEREAMGRFLDAGFADTFRSRHPDKVQYSWWSYRMAARARNIGWRIDYHCVNNGFLPRVKAAWIDDAVTGSDHCPVGVEIE